MQQIYHANAITNVNIRTQLQNSFSSSNEELSQRFNDLTYQNKPFQSGKTEILQPMFPHDQKT
jgi:hypothetical protein